MLVTFDIVVQTLQYKFKTGQTPLHIAASQSTSYEVIQLLLMNPLIDANLKNSVNETAFDIAKRSVKYFELFNMAKDLYQPIRH